MLIKNYVLRCRFSSSNYHTCFSFKIVALPADAKKDGVRIRWWQPHHDGSNGDWAIDTILIAGKVANPAEMRDGFDKYLNY